MHVLLTLAEIPLLLATGRDQPGASVVAKMEICQLKSVAVLFLDGFRIEVHPPDNAGQDVRCHIDLVAFRPLQKRIDLPLPSKLLLALMPCMSSILDLKELCNRFCGSVLLRKRAGFRYADRDQSLTASVAATVRT